MTGDAPYHPQRRRRLSDKILVAFHQACDQAEFDVAYNLIRVLEVLMAREPTVVPEPRRATKGLVAACERLWNVRHTSEAAEAFGDKPRLVFAPNPVKFAALPSESRLQREDGTAHERLRKAWK